MQNSQIEWTDHTFNPWHGCFKVSDGCKHCYAETLSKRFGRDIWGPPATTPRRMMSENYWKQPFRWDRAARETETRARVFCASMADVFEEHPGVVDARMRLFDIIHLTPNLDWLLLTKRPENVMSMLPIRWLDALPQSVWIGTSVENQEQADKRIPELLKIPARVRFLSCEPLLGPVYLKLDYGVAERPLGIVRKDMLHWVIVGGESGHGARPMSINWVRSLQTQCKQADVSFFFKQWGEHTPYYEAVDPVAGKLFMAEYPKGTMKRVGKHAAGRLLDGVEHNEMPQESR